jgi:universal stress protein F
MYQSIIVAAGLFSQGATTRGLIGKAMRLLGQGGRIIVVHVMEDMPALVSAAIPRDQFNAQRNQIRTRLEGLATTPEGNALDIDLRTGRPAREILQCAAENDADLIMIASHRPGLRDYFIGSTAARVVRHANCSVLVSRRFV